MTHRITAAELAELGADPGELDLAPLRSIPELRALRSRLVPLEVVADNLSLPAGMVEELARDGRIPATTVAARPGASPGPGRVRGAWLVGMLAAVIALLREQNVDPAAPPVRHTVEVVIPAGALRHLREVWQGPVSVVREERHRIVTTVEVELPLGEYARSDVEACVFAALEAGDLAALRVRHLGQAMPSRRLTAHPLRRPSRLIMTRM